MANYAAFLRGINVGGYKSVPMKKLKEVFESLKFKHVQTLLASGNVIFEAPRTSIAALEKKIEDGLLKRFGFEIGVHIRAMDELKRLHESKLFKGIDVTPQTRLYVTFISEKPKGSLKLPYVSPDKNFRILRASTHEVLSVIVVSPNNRSIDLMGVLEKEFGDKVTTRNWNTIIRILKTREN